MGKKRGKKIEETFVSLHVFPALGECRGSALLSSWSLSSVGFSRAHLSAARWWRACSSPLHRPSLLRWSLLRQVMAAGGAFRSVGSWGWTPEFGWASRRFPPRRGSSPLGIFKGSLLRRREWSTRSRTPLWRRIPRLPERRRTRRRYRRVGDGSGSYRMLWRWSSR